MIYFNSLIGLDISPKEKYQEELNRNEKIIILQLQPLNHRYKYRWLVF
mgnify:CR=1 FL=1